MNHKYKYLTTQQLKEKIDNEKPIITKESVALSDAEIELLRRKNEV